MLTASRRLVFALQAGAILALAVGPPVRPWLLWNATASAPIGLYAVRPDLHPKVGDLLVVHPDPALARWMIGRRYIGSNVPLVKRVAAIAGAHVCRAGVQITTDDRPVARALSRDRLGRGLPVWSGCRVLAAHQIFLLNAVPASLDGRYFGATPTASVVGRASPLWLRAKH